MLSVLAVQLSDTVVVDVPATTTPVGTVGAWVSAKVAVTATSELSVSEQVPLPEHPPDQPVKAEPGSAAATSATAVRSAKEAWQVDPQSMPAGVDETVPVPLPPGVTVSVQLTAPVVVPWTGGED